MRIFLFLALPFLFLGCQRVTQEADNFIKEHVKKVAPLTKEMNLAYWEATATGKDEAYKKYSDLELKIRKIYSNPDDFAKIKAWKDDPKITDPLIQRQLQILYANYLENQIPEELLKKIVDLSSQLEKKFNTHRADFEGKKVGDNELRKVLQEETLTERRKAAWEAFKTIGEAVKDDLLQLVKLRNEAAKHLGYPNFYVLRLATQELDEKKLLLIFDELAKDTDQPFREAKKVIDETLSKRYGIQPEAMRPWHYQDFFFQEAPDLGGVDLDPILKEKDILEVVKEFYTHLGMDVQDILSRSDLYPREGKYQHAYCMDVDREGDIRTMQNIVPNRYWLDTLLHELGHGVYSLYVDRSLPWLLREEAHIFTTEGIAEMFGHLGTDPLWLQKAFDLPKETIDAWRQPLERETKYGRLVFSRWTQVMLRFEKALYEDPSQDLNQLWWQLKAQYQGLTPPEGRDKPDWASKIHLVSSPVYYHNYMLGELFGAQLLNTLTQGDPAHADFWGHPEYGAFLKEKVFHPGKSLRWDKFVEEVTGEPLTAKYFAMLVQ